MVRQRSGWTESTDGYPNHFVEYITRLQPLLHLELARQPPLACWLMVERVSMEEAMATEEEATME